MGAVADTLFELGTTMLGCLALAAAHSAATFVVSDATTLDVTSVIASIAAAVLTASLAIGNIAAVVDTTFAAALDADAGEGWCRA